MTLMKLAVSLAAMGAALAGCGLVEQQAERREIAAQRAVPPLGDFVAVDGQSVHFVQRGAGPDVVLLHGASGNLRDFDFGLIDTLAERYRVTAFDRPGLGYTDRAVEAYGGPFDTRGETPQQQAAMLAAAARKLGIRNEIVLGHSFGGAVAMAWALDHDPAAIVAVSGAIMPWPGDLGVLQRFSGSAVGGAALPPLAAAFVGDWPVERAVDLIFAPNDPPPNYAERLGVGLTLRRETFRANARQITSLRPALVEMAPRYRNLRLPVELVHGTEDRAVPLRIHSLPVAERVPGAYLVQLEGVGHMAHHARPDVLVDAVDRAASRAGLR